MASRIAFHARLRLLTAEQGGWKSPVPKRQVCLCDVGRLHRGKPVFLDARLTLEDREELAPGDGCTVLIEPLHENLWDDVQPGQAITIQEGFAPRGSGTVLDRFLQGDVQ